jgi:hypothetical protein
VATAAGKHVLRKPTEGLNLIVMLGANTTKKKLVCACKPVALSARSNNYIVLGSLRMFYKLGIEYIHLYIF